jgi:hypothetical protein
MHVVVDPTARPDSTGSGRTVWCMVRTLRVIRLGTVLVAVVVTLSAALLMVSSLVLNNDENPTVAGPRLEVGSKTIDLPVTTAQCRKRLSECPIVEIPAGSSVTFIGLEQALALSFSGEGDIRPAVRTGQGWTVGVPDRRGTMLVTSDGHIWVLRIS